MTVIETLDEKIAQYNGSSDECIKIIQEFGVELCSLEAGQLDAVNVNKYVSQLSDWMSVIDHSEDEGMEAINVLKLYHEASRGYAKDRAWHELTTIAGNDITKKTGYHIWLAAVEYVKEYEALTA